jgi:uncharacterized membrane protein YhdT
MLIAFSVLWYISAYIFYLTNRNEKDGVFGAPVWDLLSVLLIPFITLLFAPWLVRARRIGGQRLHVIDYCALVAGFVPFLSIGVILLVLFALWRMS